MYVVQTHSIDFFEILPIIFGVLIGLAVIACGVYFYVKGQDNKKPLITKKVKVLEKPVSQGNIAWYVVECEDGERLKLRSFQDGKMIISVGDVGILSYRGQTIQDFKRQISR